MSEIEGKSRLGIVEAKFLVCTNRTWKESLSAAARCSALKERHGRHESCVPPVLIIPMPAVEVNFQVRLEACETMKIARKAALCRRHSA